MKANHNFTPPIFITTDKPPMHGGLSATPGWFGGALLPLNMGGKYQHPWGALGCSTLQIGQTTLPCREPGHKKHNNTQQPT